MLRLRPQALGYSISQFGSDLYNVVKTPFVLAKDVLELDPCAVIRDTIPTSVGKDLVKKIGCSPIGAAAMQAAVIAAAAGTGAAPAAPAIASVSNSLVQACMCRVYGSVVPGVPGYPTQPYNPFGPPQPYIPPTTTSSGPLLLLGVAAVAVVLVMSKKKTKSAPAASTTAPVVVNVKTDNEDEED